MNIYINKIRDILKDYEVNQQRAGHILKKITNNE